MDRVGMSRDHVISECYESEINSVLREKGNVFRFFAWSLTCVLLRLARRPKLIEEIKRMTSLLSELLAHSTLSKIP